MKILFSPSEGKLKNGNTTKINKNTFLFPHLHNKRMEAVHHYQLYIDSANDSKLSELFGTKKQDVIDYYKGKLLDKQTMKAIERYCGVAFDYLRYQELLSGEKKYIDTNTIIFSNLFGPILAGDASIPDYKLKQGMKIESLSLDKFYKEHFTDSLDDYLEDEEILDLRAVFYEKFYKVNKPYTTMKFIKDGKVVSHWAKAYRGTILKLMAQNNIQSIEELKNMDIPNLSIESINQVKFKSEIIYNIKS